MCARPQMAASDWDSDKIGTLTEDPGHVPSMTMEVHDVMSMTSSLITLIKSMDVYQIKLSFRTWWLNGFFPTVH